MSLKSARRTALAVIATVAFVIYPRLAAAADPCCQITAIDARTNSATARQLTTGQTFQFVLPNAATTSSLKVGQKIYANFAGGVVSLDGTRACCRIVSPSAARNSVAPSSTQSAAPAGGQKQRMAAASPTAGSLGPQRTPGPVAAASSNIQAVPVQQSVMPTASYGAPQYLSGTQDQRMNPEVKRNPLSASNVNKDVVHLAGIEGIEKAPLPEGAKDLLIMHAMTLPPEELDHYIVNTKLAEEWMRTHPAPASTKKHTTNTHSGCHAISMHCAGEASKHAQGEAERQSEKLRQQASDEWRHVSLEAAHDWRMAEDCMADHTLHLTDLPVKFSILPNIPLDFEKDVKSKNSHGNASGKVKGVLNIGLPLQGDFKARVDMFYLPCLPFAVRPKRIGAGGSMTVGTRIGAGLTATGQFQQSFQIPPSGGPHFPIEIIPIVIAGVPVAELDVSIYIDGTVDIDGEGKLDAQFKLDAEHKSAFDFDCEGKGCRFNSHSLPVPSTTSEAVKLDGRVHVKPAIYAALQLDFDVDAFTARAGPEPYLYGEVYGCLAGSATQSNMAPTAVQTSDALTADLDWGVELRAEALALNDKLGGLKIDLLNPPHQHLYFQDLIHSTGLIPTLESSGPIAVGKSVAYKMKMPTCYPYSDPLEYRVQWTGGAVANNGSGAVSARGAGNSLMSGVKPPSTGRPSSSACNLQGQQGECQGDPTKDIVFGLAWPTAGDYKLDATAVRDKHGRVFSAPAKQLNVNVH